MTRRDLSLRRQSLLFAAVGSVNLVFGFAVFTGLQLTLGRHVHYMVVLVLAWAINVSEAYITQRYLVFQVRGRFWRDFGRFTLVYAGAFAFNLVALPFAVAVLGAPVILAQTCVFAVTAAASFFGHRGFSFRRMEKAVEPHDGRG